MLRFGNSSTSDYFKLLDLDGDHLLIGARDVVYNISVRTFLEVHSIRWPSKKSVINECLMKGKPKDACHNYVRVLAKDDKNGVLVCGTNAFQPMCRKYEHEKYGEYRQVLEFSGLGIAPYDPNYNSTFLRDNDLLYAGTVSDFSGADPLIHQRNVTKVVDLGIRTERNDVKFLNEPQFVGSFRDDKYVYIWFREQAVEQELCGAGAGIYSRVARLCRSDYGGPRPYANEWTSFVKARLNCSIPGQYSFYFDQIEAISASKVSFSSESNNLIYAVFRSPLAGISLSAICAFDMKQVNAVFSHSKYTNTHQNNMQSLWMMQTQNSKFRPGNCVNDSRLLPEEAVAFARANPLMAEAIPNYFVAPVVVHSGFDHFTQIAVDAKVKAVDGHLYDVIFVGTDRGNIFKMVNMAGKNIARARQLSHHIYTLQITDEAIQNLMLYRSNTASLNESYLIAVSERSVTRVPLAQCNHFLTCYECVALRDPHCAWNLETKQCVLLDDLNGSYEQDIVTGRGDRCGTIAKLQQFFSFDTAPILNDSDEPLQDVSYVIPSSPTSTVINESCICEDKRPIPACASGSSAPVAILADSSLNSSFANNSLAISVLCASIATLAMIVGFFVGNLYCHWKVISETKSSSYPSFSTMPQPVYASTRLSSPSLNIINAYESVPKFTETFLPQRSDSPISLMVEDLSSKLPSILGQSTLPKNYRTKQIYL
ncbi:unnamed protein product [Thelazia callipaeda]|uniref:Sema domain-containing protein n=1 Tax=Thelazia callipaeda TaxID=103827 RepID=A0A0N5CYS9_THECL|nr:unnamed protein product [Thelazia callipaeda]